MIFKKFTYGRVNSTNDLALKLIKTTRYKSGFITASSQVKGRGRHGNRRRRRRAKGSSKNRRR